MRKPDFDNLLALLARDRPCRPTLFEFFLGILAMISAAMP